MASNKLSNPLDKYPIENINNTIKLCLDESQLDAAMLKELKNIFQISSSARVLEFVLFALALSELDRHKSIYYFPEYDYVQKLEKFVDGADGKNSCQIYPPKWVILAISKIIKNEYELFPFDSLEEVLRWLVELACDRALFKFISDRNDLSQKIQISFNRKEIDINLFQKIKLLFKTKSTNNAVKFVWYALALSELDKQLIFLENITGTDYIEKFEERSQKLERPTNIYVPIWTILTTLGVVKNEVKQLKFVSLIDASFDLAIGKSKCLWSSES